MNTKLKFAVWCAAMTVAFNGFINNAQAEEKIDPAKAQEYLYEAMSAPSYRDAQAACVSFGEAQAFHVGIESPYFNSIYQESYGRCMNSAVARHLPQSSGSTWVDMGGHVHSYVNGVGEVGGN